MSLINEIKEDQLSARKGGHKPSAASLTTLIGEIERIGKDDGNRETTDEESLAVIKKFIKGIDDTYKVSGKIDVNEKMLFESYLPEQLTENQIETIVSTFVTSDMSIKDMGKVMAVFKCDYSGRYDGSIVSKIVKKHLMN